MWIPQLLRHAVRGSRGIGRTRSCAVARSEVHEGGWAGLKLGYQNYWDLSAQMRYKGIEGAARGRKDRIFFNFGLEAENGF
jgi:hypothetical protein